MHKRIFFTSLCTLTFLSGCAQMQWERAGITKQELARDKFECEKLATIVIPPKPYVAPQGQMVSGIYVAPSWSQHLAANVAASGSSYVNDDLLKSCMTSKGYTWEKVKK